jgi:hypothetical protein
MWQTILSPGVSLSFTASISTSIACSPKLPQWRAGSRKKTHLLVTFPPVPSAASAQPGGDATCERLPETKRMEPCVGDTADTRDVPRDPVVNASAGARLLPLPRHAARGARSCPLPVTSAFVSPTDRARKSYRDAALSPAKPSPIRCYTPHIPLLHSRCFRCLVRGHSARDCRDPICCRICHDSGHRGYAYAMVLPREQTPHPNGRRRPPATSAASRAQARAVPFCPRSSPPPSSTPTPPPTPFNPPGDHRVRPTEHDPLFLERAPRL